MRTLDRAPLSPPYTVGTRLRYRGPLHWFAADGTTILGRGVCVNVVSQHPGRRGTLRHLRDEDGLMYDDEGEPVLDTTRDGYSVYETASGAARIIWPSDATDWEVLP